MTRENFFSKKLNFLDIKEYYSIKIEKYDSY